MRLRSRTGQIVIPALLLFPTLFLFVYLIYETAKLSRDKIKHQFAIDSAAFVEMANYSDFLNRTAYVNGAFPMRIFQEGYGDFPAECEGKHDPCNKVMYADLLYKNGAFPRSKSGKTGFSSEGQWDIEYSDPRQSQLSSKTARDPSDPKDPQGFLLFTLENANNFWHQWDLATEIYKLWVQIYSLLGSVEDAQFTVLKRLSGDHSFMKKSYWLNTQDPIGDAAMLAKSFDVALGDFNSAVTPVCQRRMHYWGNRHLGGSGIQPYAPYATDPVIDLPTSAACSQGTFQIMYVEPSMIDKLKSKTGGDYPGVLLWMNWSIPEKNYFNIDFRQLMNHEAPLGNLRTTISLQGDPNNKPAVWPDPTPKFQVRQFP